MTTQLPPQSIFDIYEQDYCLWLEKVVQVLRDGNLSELDLPHLIEELESMGKSEKRAVYSNLKILLLHLLKYRYQPEKRSNSWRYSIEEHRQRIQEAFADSPSLKVYFSEQFERCYQDAKRLAAKETGLSPTAFPAEAPFTQADTLNFDYLSD